MNTREVINKYYEYLNVGDWNNWLALFDEKVVLDEQLAGHSEGIENVSVTVGSWAKGYSKFLMHPQNILVEGYEACVIWRCEAANASGVPIDAKGVNFFRVENGKIIYLSNFHDSRPFDPFVNQKLD
jgi:ketosteroid isomerase-like protein